MREEVLFMERFITIRSQREGPASCYRCPPGSRDWSLTRFEDIHHNTFGGVEHPVFELELMGRDADLRLFGQMGSLPRGRRLRFVLILKGPNNIPCTFKQS
jgi:hypothetical protein